MEALKVKATVRKHVNVLHHLVSHFTDRLSAPEKEALHSVIHDYHKGLTPRTVPLILVKHYVRLFNLLPIQNEVYLNPHPTELMLGNRVERRKLTGEKNSKNRREGLARQQR
jgi:uncharacterized protein YbgA (DUF1722 family)